MDRSQSLNDFSRQLSQDNLDFNSFFESLTSFGLPQIPTIPTPTMAKTLDDIITGFKQDREPAQTLTQIVTSTSELPWPSISVDKSPVDASQQEHSKQQDSHSVPTSPVDPVQHKSPAAPSPVPQQVDVEDQCEGVASFNKHLTVPQAGRSTTSRQTVRTRRKRKHGDEADPERSDAQGADAAGSDGSDGWDRSDRSDSMGRRLRPKRKAAPKRLIDDETYDFGSDDGHNDDVSEGRYNQRQQQDSDSISNMPDDELEFFCTEPVLTKEEELQLRAEFHRKVKELETCGKYCRGMSPTEKKKLRNRKASCVSRLRKKLAICDLRNKFERLRERVAAQEQLSRHYQQVNDEMYARLIKYEPGYARHAAPRFPVLEGNSNSMPYPSFPNLPRLEVVKEEPDRPTRKTCRVSKRRKMEGFVSDSDIAESDGCSSEGAGTEACLCHSQEGGPMIQCDSCNIWYHLTCVGMSEDEANLRTTYHCPHCAL